MVILCNLKKKGYLVMMVKEISKIIAKIVYPEMLKIINRSFRV